MGRRIRRHSSETENRKSCAEITKVFQKLIYVSTQVFGEKKSAFLLPWKRHFGCTDAQLFVAKKTFARQLFDDRLTTYTDAILNADDSVFIEIQTYSEKIMLASDVVAAMINAKTNVIVEAKLLQAVSVIQASRRNRDLSCVVLLMEWVLVYNARLMVYPK
jgi:hypothetical protein